MKPAYAHKVQAVLSDPSSSQWLRDALRSALDRDAVDAANDAEFLAKLLAEGAEPPDLQFTFTFTARRKGSLGRLIDCEDTTVAKDESAAALKLYEKWERITLHGKPKVKLAD